MSLFAYKSLSYVLGASILLTGCMKPLPGHLALKELNLKVEEQLLQNAKVAYLKSNYDESISLLKRFHETYSSSPKKYEVQWWLAKSYEQNGNLRKALEHFRDLAQSRSLNSYQKKAVYQVQQLKDLFGVTYQQEKIRGLEVKAEELSSKANLLAIKEANIRIKGNVLVVNLQCKTRLSSMQSISILDKIRSWRKVIAKQVQPFIDNIASPEMELYIGISLRCLGQYHFNGIVQKESWMDWSYNQKLQEVRISPYYSIIASEYHATVIKLLSALGELNINGLIFLATPSSGPLDGFLPSAVKRFERRFHDSIDFPLVFKSIKNSSTPTSKLLRSDILDTSKLPAVFWKWIGWKARDRLRAMEKLVHILRIKFPHLRFGMELHAKSIYDPISGLVNFSEDWAEAAHSKFDIFMIQFPRSQENLQHRFAQTGIQFDSSLSILDRMVKHIDDPRKVWVILPKYRYQEEVNTLVSEHRNKRLGMPYNIGKIYEYHPIP